jgi:hypothetical protein
VDETGEILLSLTTPLYGRFLLRLTFSVLRTTRAHVERAWEIIREAALSA